MLPSGLLADIGQDAAVHIEDVAVDEIGSVGGQEHRRARQILRVAPAARRGLGDDELVEGMTAAVRLALPEGRGLGGGNEPGVLYNMRPHLPGAEGGWPAAR